jgi:juvenile hormone epoxide hydrolase
VGGHLTACFPQNVLGFHSNFHKIATPLSGLKTLIASLFPKIFLDDPKLSEWDFSLSSQFAFILQEMGYYHIQATKPDTIGIALSNNPAGLAAYILEKFSTLTNENFRARADGGLEEFFTLDELIDNLMIYYITNCITSASRIYKENYHDIKNHELLRVAVHVPVGAIYLRNEILPQFPFILRERYKNIIHVTYHDDGGHFATLQVPELMYDDILTFVEKTIRK